MESAESRNSRVSREAFESGQVRRAQEGTRGEDVVDLREYLDAIRSRWRMIAAATALAVLATGGVARFAMTRWYRAEAIIRPVGANVVQNRVSGLLGGLGRLGVNLFSSEASNPASQYMPVLKSFDFTSHLISGHDLKRHLNVQDTSGLWGSYREGPWARYRAMQKRFRCEFSIRTGNLTLYYEDPDRSMAGKILGFYISDLRKLLRAEQIQDSTEAIASLRAETRNTEDSLLQKQLYELLARQVQQQKLAQVDADFAFRVLQAPTTPDRPYRPDVARDSVLAGVMMLMLALAVVVLKVAWER